MDSDQKKFDQNLFYYTIFSLFWSYWVKNDQVPGNILLREKIIDSEIFILKYVSKHSESIPTKKNFSAKIFWVCHFFTIFGPKITFFWCFWVKKIFRKKNFIIVSRILFPKFSAIKHSCTFTRQGVLIKWAACSSCCCCISITIYRVWCPD